MNLLVTERGVLKHLRKKKGGTDSEYSISFAVRGSINVVYNAAAKLEQKGLVKRSERKGEVFVTLTAKAWALPSIQKGRKMTWKSFCRQMSRRSRK